MPPRKRAPAKAAAEPPAPHPGHYDIVVTRAAPHWEPTVTHAPPHAVISLWAIANGHVTVDGYGINVAGQVWYTPIDLGPNNALVCRKTRDKRSAKAQAADPSGKA